MAIDSDLIQAHIILLLVFFMDPLESDALTVRPVLGADALNLGPSGRVLWPPLVRGRRSR